MRFDLTDLRLFLHIHETGSITGGAQRTHMTLASASERVRGMEDTLGVPLLVRERHGVRVTAAGRTLLHHARAVLQQVERMHGELDQYGHGIRGHVRLLCNTAALSEYLPDALCGFLARHPRISVDVEERLSADIADAMRAGAADIGILADSADLQGLQTHPFRHDPLVLVVARGHALAQSASVGLAEIAAHDFIGLAEGSALQDHIAQHARRAGAPLNYRVRLRSFDAICRLAGGGIGIGIVPRAAARRCARATGIKAVALDAPWANRNLLLCVRRAEDLPAYALQMLRHLQGAAQPAQRK
ncbi:LysR substrate-binding domain-containing protein [Bordetella petrii]|uniref:LysR substrate-binding domain-containing protein n=1 Tax=Bordetella petrii TaxID=94624 RepID=UPI001A962C68|nr:LysR substrate-binding domain-containing protein [Bordetella petrii]MBO1110870.1 LysR family transcriptional regulator [Bordetella petrii]